MANIRFLDQVPLGVYNVDPNDISGGGTIDIYQNGILISASVPYINISGSSTVTGFSVSGSNNGVTISNIGSEYRHDFAPPYDYIAYAPEGSLDNQNVWVITRITIYSDGTTLSEKAVGVDWTNRATHIYT